MKPTKSNKKLRLSRETVADLNRKELKIVYAGKDEEEAPASLGDTGCITQCSSGDPPCNLC